MPDFTYSGTKRSPGFNSWQNSFNPDNLVMQRAPTGTDIGLPGQLWIEPLDKNYAVVNGVWIAGNRAAGVQTWINLIASGGSGLFSSLTVTPGPTSLTGTTTVTGSLATVGSMSVTSTGATVPATLTSSAATVNALNITVGGIKVPVTTSASGATPRTVSARFGTADFTTVIDAAATGALVITNTLVSASSVMLFGLSCATNGSALVVQNYVPGAGTVTVNVTNLGASNTANDIFVSFWLLN
jgi:hypothetical protein